MASELVVIAGAGAASRAGRLARLAPGSFHPGIATPRLVAGFVGGPGPGSRTSLESTPDGALYLALTRDPPAGSLVALFERAHEGGSEQPFVGLRIAPDGPGTIELRNDGVGFIPTHLHATPAGLIGSTDLFLLAALLDEADLDPAGVAEYLACMHPLNDRTLIEGVTVLPPGAVLGWRDGEGATLRRRGLLWTAPSPRPFADLAEVVEAFRPAWAATCDGLARRGGGRLVMGLSGGLDSRAIAAGLRAAGTTPKTFTYGEPMMEEQEIAVEVARRLALPHRALPIRPALRLAHLDRCLAWLDGTGSVFESFEGWLIEELAIGEGVFVTGTSGDVFWGSDVSGRGPRGGAPERVVAAKRAMYLRNLDALAPVLEDRGRQLRAGFEEGLAASFAPLDPALGPDLATAWNLAQRQRRWGFSLNAVVRRAGHRLENPFFSAPFLAFARRLPPSLREDGRAWLAIHRAAFSEVAGVRREGSALVPSLLAGGLYHPSPLRRLGQLAALARARPADLPLAARHWGRLTASRVARRAGIEPIVEARLGLRLGAWSQAFHHALWLRADPLFRRRATDALDEAIGDAPAIFDRAALRHARDGLATGRAPLDLLLLGRVVTLAGWRRRLLTLRARAAAAEEPSGPADPATGTARALA